MSCRVLFIILFGHFTAAFAALGMPPFFALILQDSLHSEALHLAGWLYAVPILCTALTAPWWGRLADRVGKRAMLMRAQLGLAISFLLAGCAQTETQFFFALVLQGVLGGTFGASNAYLASVLQGRALTRSLTLMQGSARAALVCAPPLFGIAIQWLSPITLYFYLALLPLCAFLLAWWLPTTAEAPVNEALTPGRQAVAKTVLSVVQLYWLQLGFVLATVATFPYFIPYAQQMPGVSATMAGLLFGLPHLLYLLCAAPLSRWLGKIHLLLTLASALLLLMIALLGHVWADTLTALIAWRLLMGLAMTMAFIGLHGATAAVVNSAHAGRTMGHLDSGSKWGGVAGAIMAGFAVGAGGMASPFYLGVACLIFTLAYLAKVVLAQRQPALAEE